MDIIIALVLVAGITLGVKAANKFLPFSVCAICAGVSGAWVLLSFAILTDLAQAAVYLSVITLLMGGTVVGIAYQAEKRFGWLGEKSFWFRFGIIAVGFYAAHAAVGSLSWPTFAVEIVFLAALVYVFFVRQNNGGADPKKHSVKAGKLEKELENCC